MPVAFQTYTTATADYAGGSGNLSVNPPSGLTTNDLWLISVAVDASGVDNIGTASGFTDVNSAFNADNMVSAWPVMQSQRKIAGASESAVTVPISAFSWGVAAHSQRFDGVDTTTPIGNVGSVGANAAGGASPQTVTPGSVSVAANGSMVVEHSGFNPGGNTVPGVTQSSGYTLTTRLDPSTFASCMTAYKACNAGTETPGAITWTLPFTLNNLAAQAFEINPAPVTPVPAYNVSRPWLDDVLTAPGISNTEMRSGAAWF